MKASKAEKNKPSETINLRVESSQKDLLGRRLFYLDKKQWEAFNQLLETSPADNEQLSHLLNHKAPWE